MIRKCISLVIVWMLSLAALPAQDKQLDSLLNALKQLPEDTNRVNVIGKIIGKYQYTEPTKAKDYATQMMALSKKLQFNYGLAMACHLAGGLAVGKSDYAEGAKFYKEALEVVNNKKDTRHQRLYGRIQQGLGVVAYYQEDYSTAVNYYLEAAKVYKEINDDGLLLMIYNNLSGVHTIMADKKNALKYAEDCYALCKKINDPQKTSMACITLVSAKIEMKTYDGVEAYLVESQKICEPASNYVSLGRTYSLFGLLVIGRDNDNKKAIGYFEQAVANFEKSGSMFEVAAAHQRLGEAYSIDGNYGRAKEEIMKSIEMGKQLGVLQVELHSLKSLSELEEKNSNPRDALKWLQQFNVINDSLNIENKLKQVNNLEAKYETKIKELKIAELQKEQQVQALIIRQKSTFNYILLASVFILLVIGFLAYRTYRQKQALQQQEIKQLKNEKLLLATESILKGQEEERSRLAKDLHDGLGGLLSGVKFSLSNMKDNLVITPDSMTVFERALDMIDNSIKELRRVAHNLMPEMLTRFGLDEALKEYCNTVNATGLVEVKYQSMGIDQRLNSTTEIIIYRIVQELLNNILKHAAATATFIQLIKQQDRLNIVVEDNGKGFDTSLLESSKGAGWSSIRSRVEYLQGQLDIHSGPGKGTLINIEFNL